MEAVLRSRYLTNAINILAAELQAWGIEPQDSWIKETTEMDTSDKRGDETWPQWAARKHDEAHGPSCECPGNPGRRVRGVPLPEFTVLGMPLDSSDEDYDLVQPLEALVVVKGLDSGGRVCYWAVKTPDLANVEAMGMAMFGYEVARKS
jgi:hypothetical protein